MWCGLHAQVVAHVAPRGWLGTRVLCALATTAVLALGAGPAQAQFSVQDIHLEDVANSNNRIVPPDEDKTFNRAHCICDYQMNVFIDIVQDQQSTDQLVVMAGNSCLDSDNDFIEGRGCTKLQPEKDISKFRNPDIQLLTGMKSLMPNGCDQEESQTVTVYVGSQRKWAVAPGKGERSYAVDGEPPAAPVKDDDPKAGEGLVTVSYKAGTDDNETDVYYQLLCAQRTADGGLIPWGGNEDGTFTPQYQTARLLCGVDDDAGDDQADAGTTDVDASVEIDASTVDAAVRDGGADAAIDAAADAPTDLARTDSGNTIDPADLIHDPRFLCSGRLSSDGSETIKNLQTGVTYEFWVVAFDEAENPSDVVSLGQATPGLTEDLWERYKRKGGAADGSYCTIDSSPTPLGLMLLPLAWLLLLSRRRRNRCRPAGRRLRPEQFGRLLRAEKRR